MKFTRDAGVLRAVRLLRPEALPSRARDVVAAVNASDVPGLPTRLSIVEDAEGLRLATDFTFGYPVDRLSGRIHARWITLWTLQLLEAAHVLHTLQPPHFLVSLPPAHVVVSDDRAVIVNLGIGNDCAAGGAPQFDDEVRPYTAPEVFRTGQPSPQGDVYAIGAIAWTLLTGAPPEALAADRQRHLDNRLRIKRPELMEEWREAFLSLVALDPKARGASAAESAARLARWEATPLPATPALPAHLARSTWECPTPWLEAQTAPAPGRTSRAADGTVASPVAAVDGTIVSPTSHSAARLDRTVASPTSLPAGVGGTIVSPTPHSAARLDRTVASPTSLGVDSTVLSPTPHSAAISDRTVASPTPLSAGVEGTIASPTLGTPARRGFELAIPEELLSPSSVAAEKAIEAVREERVRASRLELVNNRTIRVAAEYVPLPQNRFRRLLLELSARLSGASRSVELGLSFRELSVMLDSGIVVSHALELLSTTLEDPLLRGAYRDALAAVSAGKPLSTGLEMNRDLFPNAAIQLIKVGESTGQLQSILARLATLMENQTALTMRVRSALTYPAFASLLCGVIVVVVPAFLFDGIFELMRSLNVPVPWPTRALMQLSALVRHPLFYVGLTTAVVLVVYGYGRAMEAPASRRKRDELLLRLPVVGPCLQHVLLARFTQTLGSLYGAGVPVRLAINLAGGSTGSTVFEDMARQLAEKVEAGVTLHDAVRLVPGFPPGMAKMMATGDETGYVAEMLEFVSRLSRQEVDSKIEQALAALEPALILTMGCIVTCIVVATLSPLLRVLDSLNL